MVVFRYRACDDTGKIITGRERAENRSEILDRLSARHLHPIEISRFGERKAAPSVEEIIARYLPIPRQRLADLFDQMATLLDAGLPITEVLQSLTDQESNLRIRHAMKTVQRRVENGSPLHEAMAAAPSVFDETCVQVVRAGEYSGQLVQVLIRLSQTIEFDMQVRRRFKEATRYPKIVVGILFLASALLLTFVVPRFASLFSKANVELPLMTKGLMASGDLVRAYWPLVVFLMLLVYVVLQFLQTSREMSHQLDRFRTSIPVFGTLRMKIEMSRSFKILSLLIESGVDILSVFQLASRITRNHLLSSAFLRIREQLERGESVARSLQDMPLFPKAARQMIILGERAGTLDTSLDKISRMYERETAASLKRLNSMIEPILILGIGGMVVFFALAIFLPMWDLIKVIR